ncbi:MAG: VPS10 domain-containing protein [Acidobacteriota bacterium]
MIQWIKKGRIKLITLAFVGMAVLLSSGPDCLSAQEIDPEIYKVLQYRYIGPPGNRTAAVTGEPGNPLVYYIGASSGGVWKSTDGGNRWFPVFDDQKAQSIGALAIAPSNHNIVWAGTGEAFIRSNISIGNGVYKSTDAGKTWQHMGLEKTGRIGRIAIDAHNPDIVFAAALGHCYGPQKERGVYRTKDGGETWEKVLFADEKTGCFEIAMDPNNSQILFAGMWPLVIHTWGRFSGGPNGGIWKSTDGGDTWTHLTGQGLPEPPIGKVGLAVAPSNSEVVYALIETGHPNRGVLWRSEDGGDSWQLVSYNRLLNERPHYASRIMVNPADENEVYFAANSISRTLDGGETAEVMPWSGDCHDMWADPENPNRMMVSDDGGVIITLNRGKSWERVNLPVAQMYHVAVDNRVPYYVYGGRQDGPAYRGPSTGSQWSSWDQTGALWESTAGGECGYIIPDPVDPDIVWGGNYNAMLERANYRTGHVRTAHVWPESLYGAHASEAKYRFNWTFPIHISPHDHNRVYVGSQHVHQTTDGGRSWKLISPDLSTNDESKMGPSGGLTRDNLAVEYGCVVFTIAESPVEEGCIWAGTNDGLLHVTRNRGENWTNVTPNMPDLPEWGTFSNVEPSRYQAGKAYVTVDFHQTNNRDPFVYKTTDYGQTWDKIVDGIPVDVFSYCHWVHEDPVKPGLLYVGTENAIYVSFNDGKDWQPLQNNLPHAPVHHMVVQEHFNDLVVATYGRGFWIMEDMTPLQQLNQEVLQSDVYLFEPRFAYRLHSIVGGPSLSPRGSINYYLKDIPSGPVTITILDDQGRVVDTLTGTRNPGINRVTWNLRYPGARQTKLRNKPEGNPHVVEEKRFYKTWIREEWYPLLSWGGFAGFRGFKAAPGEYTVKLKADGKELTRTLEIRKDPNSEGTASDIQQLVEMQLKVRDDLNVVSDMISQVEWMRRQCLDLKAVLEASQDNADIMQALDHFNEKLKAVEDDLFQAIIAEGDTKSFRYPQKLYFKFSVLAEDLSKNVDFAPNQQQQEVYQVLKKRLIKHKARFDELIRKDLPALNRLLQDNQVDGIVVPDIK